MNFIVGNNVIAFLLLALVFSADDATGVSHSVQDDGQYVFVVESFDYVYPEQKEFMAQLFIDTANAWLKRRKPKLLSRTDIAVKMQADSKFLFNIDLNLKADSYEIHVYPAERIENVEKAKAAAAGIINGLRERISLNTTKWILEHGEEMREYARSRRDKEMKEAIAASQARIIELKSHGPVKAYASLASFRYKECESTANLYLDADLKKFKELFEMGLKAVEACASSEEAALKEDVALALAQRPSSVADQIKDLHAYTVASLRALTNFHQSAIEARQARAERAAGIDERVTRIELEL